MRPRIVSYVRQDDIGDALQYCDTISHILNDFFSMGDRWITSDVIVIELGGVS